MAPTRVFVCGTDTGIGKTVVAGVLACAWGARYWKPIQAGAPDATGQGSPTDSETVAGWIGAAQVLPERYRLARPLSPHLAAREEGIEIALSAFALPPGSGPLVVEGAGGLYTPIGPRAFILDLVAHLALPAVLVSRDRLGAINQTLLSLAALRARGLPVAGVVLTGPAPSGPAPAGAVDPENLRAIERYGEVAVIGRVPWLAELSPRAFGEVYRAFKWPE
ncbi:MAG: dethiobiotin synthase [Candidatus Lambdaproteobacteria bacterium]|nr:dethiobiotin synthase [Candidatus Lambdaproteobacteria bacterium]